MKNLTKNDLLIPAFAALAVLAGFLRQGLYTTALDAKGLLVRNHPLSFALLAVVLAGCALAVLAAGKDISPRVTSGIAGHSFMAVAVLMMALYCTLPLPGAVGLVWKILGLFAAPALVWAGICRRNGSIPFFGIYAALCLFLLVYLVSRYQF